MRIFFVSLASVLVFIVSVMIIKFWGKSQHYVEYKHPMLQAESEPIRFVRPGYEKLLQDLQSEKNIYLDVTFTQDQKMVLPKRKWPASEKPIRFSNYEEVKANVLLVQDFKDILKDKKIIFNLLENLQAQHEIFLHNIKELGLEKGDNFIVVSGYEAPLKSMKEIAANLVYGSTQPEILKIVAMQSMYLLEAVNVRADVIIHPLKIHNQKFFNDELMGEMKKRYKRIIVGPLEATDVNEALQLHPLAVIVND